MIRRPPASVFVAALLAIALVSILAGCSSAPAASSRPTSPASAVSAAAVLPTIKVLAPLAGSTVTGSDLSVRIETTGLKFVDPSTTRVPGEGHVHFVLDGQPVKMSITPEYVFKGLAPGPHTLRSELVQNDTAPFSPAVLETVQFTVK